jgi:hypothetical protein
LTTKSSGDKVVPMATRSPHEMLEEMQLQYNVARHSLEQLGVMVAAFRDTVPAPLEEGSRSRRVGRIKSLETWVGWLKANGPAYRKEIAEATGTPLATNATAHVRQWKDHMEMWSDDQIPGDTLLNISGPRKATGRPPVIYFLWSQRFNLMRLYGVGPIPSIDTTGTSADLHGTAAPQPEPLDPETVLGVVTPVTWQDEAWTTAQDSGEIQFVTSAAARSAHGMDPNYGEELTMDDLYNAWENGEPVDLADGPDGDGTVQSNGDDEGDGTVDG